MRLASALLFLVLACADFTFSQARPRLQPPRLTDVPVRTEETVYKTTPQGELKLHLFLPADWKKDHRRPVAVFFFGGGWKSGSFTQFAPLAEYLASRGIVAASADYRISSLHKTSPAEAVEDAKSTVRWLRTHASEWGIDPSRVIAGGGSAGGHLAAASALVPNYSSEPEGEADCAPNALVLFNPALNLAKAKSPIRDTKGQDIGAAISPTPHLHGKAPPAILFFGTADSMMDQGVEYVTKATSLGVRAELYVANGMPHGFFNRTPWTQATARQADVFLGSLGYLSGEPTVKVPEGGELVKNEAAKAK